MVELTPIMIIVTFALGMAIYNLCKSLLTGKELWIDVTLSLFLLAVMIILQMAESYHG